MAGLPDRMTFRRLVPNILTLLALVSGMTALRYALMGDFDKTIIALVIACIFDVLDGGVARMLGTSSKFGAELDSLSDVICFGLAPAIIIYEWALKDAGTFGWLAALCFTICSALRLARFNVMTGDETPNPLSKKFFTGSPAPGTTGLALLPLIASLQWPEAEVHTHRELIALWVLGLALLMVSRVPTIAMKGWKISRGWAVPVMVVVGLVAAGLVTDTWMTLLLVGGAYLITLPIGLVLHARLSRNLNAQTSA